MKTHEQVTASQLHRKVEPTCDKCGSHNVRVECFSTWNQVLQDWKVVELIETNQVCAHCGRECDIKWRLT